MLALRIFDGYIKTVNHPNILYPRCYCFSDQTLISSFLITMEYKPIPDSKAQGYRSPDVEIIEFLTEDDETVHQHARPQNSLPTDVHSTNQYHQRQYHPSQPPPEWPLSQKVYVANLTPWRTTVLVFDVILASTPIVFIGRPNLKAYSRS